MQEYIKKVKVLLLTMVVALAISIGISYFAEFEPEHINWAMGIAWLCFSGIGVVSSILICNVLGKFTFDQR